MNRVIAAVPATLVPVLLATFIVVGAACASAEAEDFSSYNGPEGKRTLVMSLVDRYLL